MKRVIRMYQYFKIVLLGSGNNRNLAFNLLVKFGARVLPIYRFTYPQMDWWSDKQFNEYLDFFDERTSFNTHRKYTLAQLMKLVRLVDGDTAECGVFMGASSYLIMKFNADSPFSKTHFVLDSFEGLSDPDVSDGSHWQQGDLSVTEQSFIKNMRNFRPNEHYEILKGWIPHRFSDIEDRKFSFVHIDVDLHQPTKDSIEFFYQRMEPGAILLCDDYGFDTCPGATKAVNDFMVDKPEEIIGLADGGAFFIKGIRSK